MMRPLHALLTSLGALLAFAVATLGAEAAIRFAYPGRLFWMAVPAAMVALYTGYLVWRGVASRAIGHPSTVAAMTASWSGRRATARAVLLAASAAFLVLALARPQWGERTREVQRKGIDIVFALDISRSMLAGDVAPERLAAATAEMERLMRLLDGDRVGLVVFAGISFVQSPLTSDYGAIRLYLDRLSPDDMPRQGTAIGHAIHEATQLLTGDEEGEFERAQNQLIIVFTDGEDHETDPVRAAAEAYAEGIHVYTVGVGTPDGARIPIRDPSGATVGYLRDRSDQVVVTRLEEEQLVAVAQAGGGSYERFATEGGAAEALDSIVSRYDEEALSSAMRQEYQDRFMFFLVPACVFLFLAALIGDRRRQRRLVAAVGTIAALALGAGCGDGLMRPDPHVNRAMEHLDAGETDAALEALNRVRAEGQELPEFRYDRGLVHEATEAYRVAQDDYLRALGAQDTAAQVSALTALGNVLVAQELYETAIERYRRALVLDPTHEGARRNLEIALRALYPPCATLDDEFEANDAPANAASLPAVVFQGEYLPPGVQPPTDQQEEKPTLTACGGNADWFAVPVVGGSLLDVEVSFERLRDDNGHAPLPESIPPTAVRIALIDVDGVTPLAVDQGLASAGERVGARAIDRALSEVPISPTVENGVAYLKVETDAPLEYTYTVEITLTPPCWALEDEYESNDRRAHATQLSEDGPHEARICADNADWFARRVQVGDALFVDVTPPQRDDGTPGAVDVHYFEGADLVDDAPVAEGLRTYAIRDRELPVDAAWQVTSADETEGAYRIDSYYYPPCPTGNDRFEPNDSYRQAHQVNPQEDPPPFRHLRLCEIDQDWFLVPLPPVEEEDRETQNRMFSALATLDGDPIPMQVAVYDPQSGQGVATGQPVQSAPPTAFVGEPPSGSGVVAAAEIPWETEALLVLVAGEGPAFYDLSFPHTEQQEQQQQSGQDGEPEDSEEEGEDGEESESDSSDPQEQGEQEGEPQESEEGEESEDASAEDEPTEEESESPTPEEAQRTDEEVQRELLMQLLDSLESEDVNLPMQQALEAAPNVRSRNEW